MEVQHNYTLTHKYIYTHKDTDLHIISAENK
jgi:hypothetical protein